MRMLVRIRGRSFVLSIGVPNIIIEFERAASRDATGDETDGARGRARPGSSLSLFHRFSQLLSREVQMIKLYSCVKRLGVEGHAKAEAVEVIQLWSVVKS